MPEYETTIKIEAETEERCNEMIWEMLRVHGLKTQSVRTIRLYSCEEELAKHENR